VINIRFYDIAFVVLTRGYFKEVVREMACIPALINANIQPLFLLFSASMGELDYLNPKALQGANITFSN